MRTLDDLHKTSSESESESITRGEDIDIFNAVKIICRLSALVESLATASLQAKPAWAKDKAKQVPQCLALSIAREQQSNDIIRHLDSNFSRCCNSL